MSILLVAVPIVIDRKQTYCWKCGGVVRKIKYSECAEIPKCPHCGVRYPEKPKIEALLTLQQESYLEDRSQSNLNALFFTLHKLTYNIICSKLKHSAMSLSRERIEDMTQWSLMKILSYYKEKPDFKINGSFIGYVSQVVLYPLYNKKDKDMELNEISIDAPIGNGCDKERNLLDIISLESMNSDIMVENRILSRNDYDSMIDHVGEFIEKMLDTMYDSSEKNGEKGKFTKVMEMVTAYRHFIFKKHENFFSEIWKTCSCGLEDEFNATMKILKKTLCSNNY